MDRYGIATCVNIYQSYQPLCSGSQSYLECLPDRRQVRDVRAAMIENPAIRAIDAPRVMTAILSQMEPMFPAAITIANPTIVDATKAGIIQLPAVIISAYSLTTVFLEASRAFTKKSNRAIIALLGISTVNIAFSFPAWISTFPLPNCTLQSLASLQGRAYKPLLPRTLLTQENAPLSRAGSPLLRTAKSSQ